MSKSLGQFRSRRQGELSDIVAEDRLEINGLEWLCVYARGSLNNKNGLELVKCRY